MFLHAPLSGERTFSDLALRGSTYNAPEFKIFGPLYPRRHDPKPQLRDVPKVNLDLTTSLRMLHLQRQSHRSGRVSGIRQSTTQLPKIFPVKSFFAALKHPSFIFSSIFKIQPLSVFVHPLREEFDTRHYVMYLTLRDLKGEHLAK